ncbi:MAG: hypothetical protein IID48_01505 [Proteobacteria bacterium]|nr:hypothetical protein [Pseudomonadota bacterium]
MQNTALKGRSCFITGASGGLDGALTERLAEAGCRLFLAGQRGDRLVKLAQVMRRAGSR